MNMLAAKLQDVRFTNNCAALTDRYLGCRLRILPENSQTERNTATKKVLTSDMLLETDARVAPCSVLEF